MPENRLVRILSFGLITMLATACGDNASNGDADAAPTPDAAAAIDAMPDAHVETPAERGAYLVHNVALCADCHTPRLPSGMPDMANFMAGAECFVDIDPGTAGVGCLHTRNLTNHATGLANRTDAQIKTMFMDGLRPNNAALIPVMPYWSFHNMTSDDADAIVAYLRTVPGVDHAVPANEAPWTAPPAPATAIEPSTIPSPATNDPNFDSAMRGRYLATMAGVCMECHTPELDPQTNPVRPIDMTQPFAGGRSFPGLPMPPFTTTVSTSANLTSHATGLAGWNALDVIKVLEMGLDKDNDVICPPMPAGPMQAYGNLTDEDTADIANYILTLPAIDNTIAGTCSLAAP